MERNDAGLIVSLSGLGLLLVGLMTFNLLALLAGLIVLTWTLGLPHLGGHEKHL